ncbi:hypothetical protein JMJ55_08785 [Belnapia sp. T6]|uniref:Uncharacterized protein n=1 Tax=Belnapia mucosa TaxID=2804532 RepID=A0ABS1V143_9PROT|nr:hypothetical protein [Belnapia mucosa]MBL6455415.1 hypothetical protein [Belnapia mucosa]
MSDSAPPPASPRLEAIQCPHCDEVTMPNRLPDGSTVCSCTAERAIPAGPGEEPLAAPMDTAQEKRGPLPEDHGQFGEDIATEDYKRM